MAGRLQSFRSPELLNPGFHAQWENKSFSVTFPQRDQFDWRQNGLNFVVRDQGNWNACTSFAMTAMVEARAARAGNPLPRLMGGFLHCCVRGISDPDAPQNCHVIRDAAMNPGIKVGNTDGPPLVGALCSTAGAQLHRISGGDYTEPGAAACNRLVANGPMLVEVMVPRDFDQIGPHVEISLAPGPDKVLHSMLLVGYHWTNGTITVLNSFGSAWGNHGCATLTMASTAFKALYPFEIIP